MADEASIAYNDKDRINDFIETIPNKAIILQLPPHEEKDYTLWKMYNEKFEGGFCVAIHDLNDADAMNNNGIKWYWPYPITSFYELQMVLRLGPSQIVLGAPLSFSLSVVNNLSPEVKKRMVVNKAKPNYVPAVGHFEAIVGQWVRPEDVAAYEPYIDVMEFDTTGDNRLKKEETLLHIYKDNKFWPGDLGLIIDDLNIHVDNRAIPNEFGERRINCEQKCERGSSCHFCDMAFQFAEHLRSYKAEESGVKE
jgi:hypothetical protein